MKKENNKIKNKWALVAAVCYYISSIILFISRENRTMAITNLCLGSCFLSFALTKDKK